MQLGQTYACKQVSVTAATAAAVLAMYFGWMDLYVWGRAWAWVSWGHTTQIRMAKKRDRENKTGSGRKSQTTGEDSYKPWSDFGGQRPPPSCHFSYMQWDGERPSLKEDQSPGQYRKKGRYKTKEKKEKSTGFRSLGTNLKEEKEN